MVDTYISIINRSLVEKPLSTLQVIERKAKGRIVLEMSDANGLMKVGSGQSAKPDRKSTILSILIEESFK